MMIESEGKFWRLGLVGYPLGHSLSPSLHAAALAAHDLAGEYSLYQIPPDDLSQLKALLNRMRDGALDGLNLTIPHKQSVLPYLDELSHTAAETGAVNTIYLDGDHLAGDNTDVPGFKADLALQTGWDLEALNPETPSPRTALVLGAGGSARAVVYALCRSGWQVWVCARRREQAARLMTNLERCCLHPSAYLPWDALNNLANRIPSQIDLLVNTTPLGMAPDISSSPWPEGIGLPHTTFIYDLVYNPAQTTLLRQARSEGLASANGLGMLVEQAALALERWTGLSAPRQTMADSVKQISSTRSP